MSKKLIALDDGHGMQTAGKRTPTLPNGEKSSTGSFMHENEFNEAVVKYLDVHLKRNGFDTLLVAPTDEDTSLQARTSLANAKGADVYISVHANASTGKFGHWGGIETFCMPNGVSRKLGDIVHKWLLKNSPLQDRKVKDGSHLWVIRKTTMSSVLVECGFMDSHKDYKYLLSDSYRRECAYEIANGICEFYGVKYKEEAKVESKPAIKPTPKPVEKPVVKVASNAKSHTVEKGETFYSIAKEYDMTVDKLQAFNPRVKADKLQVGDVIHLVAVPASAVEKPKAIVKPTPKPAVKPVAKAVLSYKRPLKKGLEGKDVEALQKALNTLNFKVGAVDGSYGTKTEDAVKRFQKVHLPKEVDGMAGQDTINKINSLIK